MQWMKIEDEVPMHGQTILCMANNQGTWTEVWDAFGPRGCLSYWLAIPKLPNPREES